MVPACPLPAEGSLWRPFPYQRTVPRCHSQPWLFLSLSCPTAYSLPRPHWPLTQHPLDFPLDTTTVVFNHTNSSSTGRLIPNLQHLPRIFGAPNTQPLLGCFCGWQARAPLKIVEHNRARALLSTAPTALPPPARRNDPANTKWHLSALSSKLSGDIAITALK